MSIFIATVMLFIPPPPQFIYKAEAHTLIQMDSGRDSILIGRSDQAKSLVIQPRPQGLPFSHCWEKVFPQC